MLIKYTEWLTKSKLLRGKQYLGIVVNNIDPNHLGRVKCGITGLIEADNDIKLPWVYPSMPYFLGGAEDKMEFSVPELNSELVIEFPYEDIYFGFYKARWHSKTSHVQTVFDEDYPESYGCIDPQGTYYKINKAKKYALFSHVSGSKVKFLENGNIEILAIGNRLTKINGNKQEDTDGDSLMEIGGNLNIDAGLNVKITSGQSIVLEAPSVMIRTKSFNVMGTEGSDVRSSITGDLDIEGHIDLEGDIEQIGGINSSGNIIDGGSNTNHHTHP